VAFLRAPWGAVGGWNEGLFLPGGEIDGGAPGVLMASPPEESWVIVDHGAEVTRPMDAPEGGGQAFPSLGPGVQAVAAAAAAADGSEAEAGLDVAKSGLVKVVAKNWRKEVALFGAELVQRRREIQIDKLSGKKSGKGKTYVTGQLLAADGYTEPPAIEHGISLVLEIKGEQVIETVTLSSEMDRQDWLRSLNAGLHLEQVFQSKIAAVDLQLGTLLGSGGFGEVYRAEYCGVAVAAKIIRVEDTQGTVAFAQEAGVLARLDHPNVLRFVGISVLEDKAAVAGGGGGDDAEEAAARAAREPRSSIAWGEPALALVVELCPYGTLSSVLHEMVGSRIVGPGDTPLSTTDRRKILQGIAAGLAYIHSRAVIHRDLKPENVMLGVGRTAKLVDFGQSRSEALDRYMTANTCGTLLWRAPEVSPGRREGVIPRKSAYSTAVDVYSLGIIMWETFSRLEPYKDVENTWDLIRGVREGHLRPACDATWPAAVCVLMTQCWAHDPAARPTADEVATQLADPAVVAVGDDGGAAAAADEEAESYDLAAEVEAEAAAVSGGTPPAPSEAELPTNPLLLGIAMRARRIGRGPNLVNDFPALVMALRQPSEEGGLVLSTQKWFLLKFKECFVGRELVAWIVDRCGVPVDRAVAVGVRLQQLGLINHSIKGVKFSATCFFFWQPDQVVERLVLLEEAKRERLTSRTRSLSVDLRAVKDANEAHSTRESGAAAD